ncbi:MAG: YraN family protein [Candidatus Gracilibacteria bacterium]
MNTQKSRREVGNIGEEMAISYLVEQGYHIVDRNATFLGGELDIIARLDGLWRFIEVKYRETTIFGMPEDSMTPKKVKTLLRAIEFYCLKKGIDILEVRLDFLGILKKPDTTYEYRLIQDVN